MIRNVGMIGTGNMGSAILRGIVEASYVKPTQLTVFDVSRRKLKEIEEANEKLEQERQKTLSQTKKITVPVVKNEKTTTVKNIPVVELPKENTGETPAVTPKIQQVKIAKVEIPKRQEVEITDLPPVKPIEITQVQRRTGTPKVTVFETEEKDGKEDENHGG